ncbi:hypothetical protein FUSO5_11075 [Fusobacterium necrophorum BFTR-1]|uniref:hypothetical protein n=1 Tax=Fusobacterium necrophorum TaxID=859 RepID=UPI000460F9AB|nr:hypothetical protein [Fusobacterium necrophorum]KDE61752.1 hypothetical protein FUSO5_11075 [Fusobacterium necrophorum BFTR-1]
MFFYFVVKKHEIKCQIKYTENIDLNVKYYSLKLTKKRRNDIEEYYNSHKGEIDKYIGAKSILKKLSGSEKLEIKKWKKRAYFWYNYND